jgi:hypothetical protein
MIVGPNKYDRGTEMDKRFGVLCNAVAAIYFRAHWSPDRPVDNEDELWENLRKAAGYAPGYSTQVLGPRRE